MERTLRTLFLLAALASPFLTGCSDDTTNPNTDEISTEAREAAVARTDEVLQAEHMMQTARQVEELTGGFAVGLADETSGLDMELGDGFDIPEDNFGLSASAMLVRGGHAAAKTKRIPTMENASLHRAPGDLIASFTENNLDGSVSTINIYETDSADVVRVTRDTEWPNGNLILESIADEILIDLGNDLDSDADDSWLYLNSEIVFVGGQSLTRVIDLQEQGGLEPNAQIEVVSTFVPRPNHPRLVDVVSTLVIDVATLEDEDDDLFVSIDRVTTFSGVAHDGNSPRVIESLVPEIPVAEGEEPCGGTLSRMTWFREDRALKSWNDSANWSCDGGGQLSRAIVYADDSQDAVTITENAQGVVTLETIERDGTEIDGTYDPNDRSFEITTVFPAGSDPVQSTVSGSTNEDETSFSLSEQITYLDGFVESNTLNGSETESGSNLNGEHVGRDETVSFDLSSNADETRLEGWVENDQEERIEFTAEELPDGSALLDFVATEPGLRVVGHLESDPTGCGTGTLEITENDATVVITFDFCEGDLDEDPILAGN